MQVTLSVHGQNRDAFQPHELQHMADVRNLFSLAMRAGTGCLIFFAASLLLLLLWLRGLRPLFSRVFVRTSLTLFTAVAGIALWAVIDFDGLFRFFHRIAFTNQLWLLNPRTDLLIQLMPLQFFISYATQIGLGWLILMGLALGIALKSAKFQKKRVQNP